MTDRDLTRAEVEALEMAEAKAVHLHALTSAMGPQNVAKLIADAIRALEPPTDLAARVEEARK
jgi:hypothetical protein